MKLFRIGCYVLLGTAVSHGVAQFIFARPQNAAEKETMDFMHTHMRTIAGNHMPILGYSKRS